MEQSETNFLCYEKRLTTNKKTTVKPRKVMFLQICLQSTHVQLLESRRHSALQFAVYQPPILWFARVLLPRDLARFYFPVFGGMLTPC